jgi:hypothetical protein
MCNILRATMNINKAVLLANGGGKLIGWTAVFNYWPPFHNVVAVDAKGYKSCSTGGRSRPLSSGNDTITVKKGDNYFICSRPLHCAFGGMKLAITAD